MTYTIYDDAASAYLAELSTGLTAGGNKSTSIAKNIIIIRQPRDGGYLTFTIYNPEFTDLASIAALEMDTIKVKDVDNVVLIEAEVKKLEYDFSNWTCKVHAIDLFKKLRNIYVSYYDPTIYSGTIKAVKVDGLIDYENAAFTINEFQNDFCTVKDTSTTNRKYYPRTSAPITWYEVDADHSGVGALAIPEASYGDVTKIFYNDLDYSRTNSNEYSWWNVANNDWDELYADIHYHIAMDAPTDLTSVSFRLTGRFGMAISEDAKVFVKKISDGSLTEIYNFDTSSLGPTDWDWVDAGADRVGFSSFVISVDIPFSVTDNDYTNWLNLVDDDNNNLYEMQLFIYTGGVLTAPGTDWYYGTCLYETYVEVGFGVSQYVSNATRKIDSNDADEINLDATSMFAYFPTQDYWSAFNTFVITPHIGTIIAAIWASFGVHTLTFTANTDVTDIQIIEYMSLYEIVKKYCDILRYEFWYDNGFIYCTDSFTDTGYDLDETDLVAHIPSTYSRDANNIRNNLIILGGSNTKAITSLSPETAVSDEDALIVDLDILSEGQADVLGTSLAEDYQKAIKSFNITIWYDDPNKTYTAIGICKEIGLKLWSLFDFTDATGDGDLFISRIVYFQVENKDYATLTLERRYT